MKSASIAIASDHAGFEMKEIIKQEIRNLGLEVVDLGPNDASSVDYPDYANLMAKWIKEHEGSKGVLICGSGMGMAMAANRHRHVRAAVCHNGLTAALSRRHNDSNVLCLGSRLIGSEIAKDCVQQFLASEFEGGRHQTRIEKMS